MTYHPICPWFTLTSSHSLLNRPPSQTHAFKNNLLSVLIGVYMCTSIGLSSRTWKRNQKASVQRRITLISPQVINCQELLSKESHEDDLFHLCWFDSVKVTTAALSSWMGYWCHISEGTTSEHCSPSSCCYILSVSSSVIFPDLWGKDLVY